MQTGEQVWRPSEVSDDEDLVPPIVIGCDSSDGELIEGRNEELASQQSPDVAFDTDEEMILSDPTGMPNSECTPEVKSWCEAEAATHPPVNAAGEAVK